MLLSECWILLYLLNSVGLLLADSYLWINMVLLRLGFNLFYSVCSGTFILWLNITMTWEFFISSCPCQFLGVSFYTCTLSYSAGPSRTPLYIFQELLFPTTYSLGGWDSNTIRLFSSCRLTCSIVRVTYFTSGFRLLNFKGWKENWSLSKNLRY